MENVKKQEKDLRGPKTVAAPKQVLVIDDSPDIIMIMRAILEQGDYKVFTVQSGAEAFEFLTENDKPDLILLDMNMNDMNGPEFLEMLEKKRPDLVREIPVVFVTAMDQIPKGRSVGFVRKPIVDMKKFLVSIRHFMEAGPQVARQTH